jgi:RNA polymerase sigma-70 factor (ECF subfamily)
VTGHVINPGPVGTDGRSHGQWSDVDLVAAVVLRSEDAYAELFRRHQRSVTAASRMVFGHSLQCEDVVAEVFASFWQSPEAFDPTRGSLLSFMRLKARGRSIDIIRADVSRRRRERPDVVLVPPPSTEEAALASDYAPVIEGALLRLPERESLPIQLAFFRGMTYQAIATHLNLPEGTVKSRIRQGLRRLRLDPGILGCEETAALAGQFVDDGLSASSAR